MTNNNKLFCVALWEQLNENATTLASGRLINILARRFFSLNLNLQKNVSREIVTSDKFDYQFLDKIVIKKTTNKTMKRASAMNTTNINQTNEHVPLTNAIVQLSGQDGNAFLILGRIKRAIVKSNHPELAQAFMDEATAGDYDHLLQTCIRYVTVE